MYLSKLTLDPRHPQARRDLGDAYEMHRTLARAFAPTAVSPPHRFLWRLERRTGLWSSGAYSGALPSVVLIQSAQMADWSVLDSHPGYAEEIRPNKLLDLDVLLQAGARYRFRLLANPTVTRVGKRYGLTREEDQLAWMVRQGERHGFSILGCVRAAEERLQVRQGRTGNRITVHTALFDGTFQADCVEALRKGLSNGFGHARALGLGLLSMARIF
ncbi:MAG: type I-E CRISPR-associated protein Cas6/Cse3/CasE [Candidatus Accumulibacter necessarius]|jgi:CRISPR system Cascade subunit CasE|uniref:type I-E CRISPR-associated protein Cas6/Cse3/CasE n=1 Tax=Candidatus Accumulibacter necessarius TaxID=2954386 RepID=UPI002FC33140